MFKNKKNIAICSGFTLLEMIVAVGILSVVVIFALSTIWRGTKTGTYATDEMMASYLAQDAMEYIRAKKNENITNGADWLNGFPPVCTNPAAQECQVDTTNEVVPFMVFCGGGGCLPISFETTLYTYGYGVPAGTWVPTKFTRSVSMNEIVNDREVQVSVLVTFPQGISTKSVQFFQNMYNVI